MNAQRVYEQTFDWVWDQISDRCNKLAEEKIRTQVERKVVRAASVQLWEPLVIVVKLHVELRVEEQAYQNVRKGD